HGGEQGPALRPIVATRRTHPPVRDRAVLDACSQREEAVRVRRSSYGLCAAALGTLLVLNAGAASASPTARPKTNDGLPTEWSGLTDSRLDADLGPQQHESLSTDASVGFTLVQKEPSRVGTHYIYKPTSGHITIKSKGTAPGCTTTLTANELPIRSDEGVLEMWVPRPGKRPPAEYDASSGIGTPRLTQRTVCPATGTDYPKKTNVP